MAKKTSISHRSGKGLKKKGAKQAARKNTAGGTAAKKAASKAKQARQSAVKKAAAKPPAGAAAGRKKKKPAPPPPGGPPAASNVMVVNMMPNSLSGESGQDAEPNLAVNPANPQQIVATAFTANPAGGDRAPYYLSSDGGQTWLLNAVVPSGVAIIQGQMFGSETGDITVAFSGQSGRLYAGILQDTSDPNNFPMNFLTTPDATSPALMTIIGGRGGPDQPYVEAITPTTGANAGKDALYIGSNDTDVQDGKSSTIDFSLDAGAGRPQFRTVRLEVRDTGNAGQDGPQVRPVCHADGTVYAVYTGWRATKGTFSANTLMVTSDIVVVRDGNLGAGAKPFTDLVDPGDNKPGIRVVQSIQFPFHQSGRGVPGQNRFGGDLSIAVDPRDSKVVYLAYGEGPDVLKYTLHVVMSKDSGQTWSSDLITVRAATNPSLAVNNVGKLGFLYQQLTGSDPVFRWETHFQRTLDGSRWVDLILATVPADNPPKQGDPYLGDYDRVTAVGADFCGVFSASNIPDKRNFPNGVVYQRNADFDNQRLLDVTNTREVRVSIDPFFFKVKES